jgi:hypothetical protein
MPESENLAEIDRQFTSTGPGSPEARALRASDIGYRISDIGYQISAGERAVNVFKSNRFLSQMNFQNFVLN